MADFFQIEVVDAQTGRGVSLVELQTTNNACYYTSLAGLVAFSAPGMMNRKDFFQILIKRSQPSGSP